MAQNVDHTTSPFPHPPHPSKNFTFIILTSSITKITHLPPSPLQITPHTINPKNHPLDLKKHIFDPRNHSQNFENHPLTPPLTPPLPPSLIHTPKSYYLKIIPPPYHKSKMCVPFVGISLF